MPMIRWSGILQQYECSKCHMTIPAHLAERWNGISYEQAVEEWQKRYRATAPKETEE